MNALAETRSAPKFDPFDIETVRVRLAAFMAQQGLDDLTIGPLRRYTVGFSWVTYGFRASWRDASGRSERDLILRVGPDNGIFGPYKAAPEFTTLKALAGSGVPVPKVYWYSDEREALGAPFFVCDLVPGDAPIPWTHDGGLAFDEPTRINLGNQFLDALAALHTFAWEKTPVATIGGITDPAGTARGQVELWEGLLADWSERRVPMLEYAALWLKAHAPVAPRVSVVHGDFRIGNFLVADNRITAILDWELVRLGDPVEDLGWICLQAWRGKLPYMCHLFTREELFERYSALTGLKFGLADMRWWEAFGTYKLAVMHYGASHCFEKRGFNDLRMAGMDAQIPRMLLQVESALERTA
jgi:aminoglycoside phosphotransferase (APT) family kinase protein